MRPGLDEWENVASPVLQRFDQK